LGIFLILVQVSLLGSSAFGSLLSCGNIFKLMPDDRYFVNYDGRQWLSHNTNRPTPSFRYHHNVRPPNQPLRLDGRTGFLAYESLYDGWSMQIEYSANPIGAKTQGVVQSFYSGPSNELIPVFQFEVKRIQENAPYTDYSHPFSDHHVYKMEGKLLMPGAPEQEATLFIVGKEDLTGGPQFSGIKIEKFALAIENKPPMALPRPIMRAAPPEFNVAHGFQSFVRLPGGRNGVAETANPLN